MDDLRNLLSYELFGNPIKIYLIALGIFLSVVILFQFTQNIVIKRLKKFTKKTKSKIDDLMVDMLDRIGWPFYTTLGLFAASTYLELPQIISNVLIYTFIVIATWQAILILQKVVDHGTEKALRKANSNKDIIRILSSFLKISLWIIAGILILSNLGYNVSSLIAGLGIGGIAIALAMQNILSDIFSSFSIYLDKPFQVDDFVVIGQHRGTVTKIGIKTTRIQSVQGEEIVFANKDLLNTVIQNFKKMARRKVVFLIGVTYQTKTSLLRKIPKLVKEIFANIKLADLERVHFKNFGDSNLQFEIAYFVNSQDYVAYLDTQQRVNLALKTAFEKEGISFAYPTQTVYVNSQN
ncbi:MAG: mechanosensitive ion channel family protein [Candidatus Gracilibacteria bacterium]|nr:mechanosensitive ion channel family protein [Candidatus Gracilibacteria bacterium]